MTCARDVRLLCFTSVGKYEVKGGLLVPTSIELAKSDLEYKGRLVAPLEEDREDDSVGGCSSGDECSSDISSRDMEKGMDGRRTPEWF
jgi:hypothetical protein